MVHLSHTFLPVFALVACAALSVWRLFVLLNSRTLKSAWLFGASIAFGLLVHPHFLWMTGAPALFSVAAVFRGEGGKVFSGWEKPPGQLRFLLLGFIPPRWFF